MFLVIKTRGQQRVVFTTCTCGTVERDDFAIGCRAVIYESYTRHMDNTIWELYEHRAGTQSSKLTVRAPGQLR